MRKKIWVLILVVAVSCFSAGCQGPHMLSEFLLRDHFQSEQIFPLVTGLAENAFVPVQLRKRDVYMEFPVMNMTDTVIAVEEQQPYWAMSVRNLGHTAMTVGIGSKSVRVSPGDCRWIYTAEPAQPGEQRITFCADTGGALSGSMDLWYASEAEELIPQYEITARIHSVKETYFEAELLEKSPELVTSSFFGGFPDQYQAEGRLREDSIVKIRYTGGFTGGLPNILEGIREIELVSSVNETS